jgi:hypothetical protein
LQHSPEQIETFSIVSGEKRRRLGKNVVDNLKRFLLYLPATSVETLGEGDSST